MMKRFQSWPIRVYLMILVAVVAIPSISLIVYTGITGRRQAVTDAKAEVLKFVNEAASQQQSIVAGAEQLGTALSSHPTIQSRNPAAANALFSDLLKKNPQYSNIAICDKSGIVWASAVPTDGKVSVADRRFIKEAIRTGQFSSGEYVVSRAVKKPVMSFGYPVKNKANDLIGVIGIILDLNYAQRLFEKLNLPPNSAFNLLDHQGIILGMNLNNPNREKFIGRKDIEQGPFTKMREGREEGTFEAVANDGRFRLAAYKKLKLPHESEPYLYIRSSIPLASATSKANAVMLRNLSIFVLLLLIGLILAWLIGERVIAKPVTLLKKASEKLASGTDTVNVSEEVKDGELGDLARTFDDMAEALVQREMAQHAAETALRESEQRWATTLASVGDAVIATDVEGKITFMNATAEALTGWTMRDAAKKPAVEVFNIVNEQTRHQVESPIAKVLREGMVVGLANHTILVRKDGTEVPIDDSGAPIKDRDGKTSGVVLVFRDITERKRAEAAVEETRRALEREKDILQTVMNGAKNSHLVYLDRNFNFVRVNEAYARTCGYTPSEMVGKNHFALYPHEENEGIFARVRDEGAPVEFHDKPFVFPDQPERGVTYWDWTLIPVKNDLGNVEGLVFSLVETTERKRAEERTEHLASFPQLNPNPIMEVDASGRITFFNPATQAILDSLGLEEKDVTAFLPEDMESILGNSGNRDQSIFSREVVIAGRAFDETIHLVPQFKVARIYARDITARKRAEEELKDNIQLLNDTIDGSPSPIFLKDGDGKFITINASLERMLGMSRQELKGKTDYDIAPKEVADTWWSHDTKVMTTGKAIQIEEVADLQDGHHIFLANKFPLVNANGQVYGVGSISHDITERKRMEEELRQSRDELEVRVRTRTQELSTANEKLTQSEQRLKHLSARLLEAQEEERRRFAGEVHDSFGASLSAIKFKIEAMQKENGTKPEDLEHLKSRVQDLIGDARRIQVALRPSVLDDLGIVSALGWFTREYQKTYSHMDVMNRIDVKEDQVPDRLKTPIFRIVQESFNNAAKHSKAKAVTLSLTQKDSILRLEIQDDGMGFGIKSLEALEHSARGLGLSSMEERASLSGGIFSVHSEAGKGTTVRITWPLK